MTTPKHLTTLMDWSTENVRDVLALGHKLKAELRAGTLEPTLARKTLALVFEKPSMRTRVSFEVAMTQLGGNSIYLTTADIALGKREPIKDGARVLARYVDVVAARVFVHSTIEELALYSDIPIINALSDWAHPCQALADAMTIQENNEQCGRIVYIGDANNVARSLGTVCAHLGWQFVIAAPKGYEMDDATMQRLGELAATTGGSIAATSDPRRAATGASVLYTDTWTSMGQEEEAERRRRDFAGFTVDADMLALAAPDAVVMHCLPAHRGEEATDEVLESPQSVIFDQAENRQHAARAVIALLT